MAYQCSKCTRYIADKDSHECIYDELSSVKSLVNDLETEIMTLNYDFEAMNSLGDEKIKLLENEIKLLWEVAHAARNLLDMYDEVHWRDPERDIQNALKELDKVKK